MTTVLDEDGCRMWVDDFSPILFIKFSTIPTGCQQSKQLLKKCKGTLDSIASKFDYLYSVIDTGECSECSIKLVKLCFAYFPSVLRHEVKYLALVTPLEVDYTMRAELSKIMSSETEAEWDCFSGFYRALSRINLLRQQAIA